MKPINNLHKVYREITKKQIFIVDDQTVTNSEGEDFVLPRCKYVQVGWDDWNKLHDAIQKVKG